MLMLILNIVLVLVMILALLLIINNNTSDAGVSACAYIIFSSYTITNTHVIDSIIAGITSNASTCTDISTFIEGGIKLI